MQCIQISILSPSIWPAIISTGRPFPADGPVGPFRLIVQTIRHRNADLLCIRSGRLAGATGDGENIFHLTTEGVSD